MNPFQNISIISKIKILIYYLELVYKEDFVKIHKALAFISISLGTLAMLLSYYYKDNGLREYNTLCLILAVINLDLVISRMEKKNG